MSDIPDRLRSLRGDYRLAVCIEAADEIERLQRQRDRLLSALKELTFRAHLQPEDEYAETEALAAIAECEDA